MKSKKNISYSLAGLGLPVIVGLFAIPILVRNLGATEFGALTIAWALLSYAGILDVGISRAVTFEISKSLGKKNKLAKIYLNAKLLGLLVGLVIGLIACGCLLLNINESLIEYKNTGIIISISTPLLIVTSIERGALEGLGFFKEVNLGRFFSGIYTFLMPAAISFWIKDSIFYIVVSLVIGKIGLYYYYNVKSPILIFFRIQDIDLRYVSRIWKTGKWIAVNNIIDPMMGYLDRFVIGYALGGNYVAYYVAPLETISKILILPGAITSVQFPEVAKESENINIWNLSRKYIIAVYIILFPLLLATSIFSETWLTLWLGQNYYQEARLIVPIFCAGIFINAVSFISYSTIQGMGWSRFLTILLAVEFVSYASALIYAVALFGLLGAAIAWVVRIALNNAVLHVKLGCDLSFLKKSIFVSISTLISGFTIGIAGFVR